VHLDNALNFNGKCTWETIKKGNGYYIIDIIMEIWFWGEGQMTCWGIRCRTPSECVSVSRALCGGKNNTYTCVYFYIVYIYIYISKSLGIVGGIVCQVPLKRTASVAASA